MVRALLFAGAALAVVHLAGGAAGPRESLPAALVNDDGTALTFEIFRNAESGAAKTHWVPTNPNLNFRTRDPRGIPVEPYDSFEAFADVRWSGIERVAPDVSFGIALCVNLSKPWPYAFDQGVYPEHPVWGKDPLSPFIDWSREKGIEPFFSIRMNDQHHSIYNYPQYHAGRFFWDRPELFIDPPSPEEWEEHYLPWINTGDDEPKPLPRSYRKGGADYHDLRVNYAFEEVRDFYVGLATDLAERHPEVAGIELDFMRSAKFFPDGEEEPEILTEVVRRIRANLRRVEQESGKKIALVARVPVKFRGDVHGYEAGLRVEQWLDEGLLDGIILGHGNRIADNPLGELAEYAKERDTKVYGPLERMYFDSRIREATPEKLRGAASTVYGKGADGLYFFNWFGAEEHYLLPQLVNKRELQRSSKVYFADGARIKRGDKPFGSRMIRSPLNHRVGEESSVYRFELWVNTDFEAACDTRLTVHTGNIRREFINVTVNGRDVTDEMHLVYGANRLSYRLPDELTRELLRNGPNEIDVSLAPNPFDEDLVIEGVTGTFLY